MLRPARGAETAIWMNSLVMWSGVTGRLLGYGTAVVAVGIASLITTFIVHWIGPSISLLFFPAVLVTAVFCGYGPALVATLLSTLALAFLFVPPRYSLNIGIDDLIRLAVFVLVALATAWISAARKTAEDALRHSLGDLQRANGVLRQVREWPSLLEPDRPEEIRSLLLHAAGVVGASNALGAWEIEEEPWIYVATTSPGAGVTRHRLIAFDAAAFESDLLWSLPDNPIAKSANGRPIAGAAFKEEHLTGRMFFVELPAQAVASALDVVAREMGNSLERLHLARQMRHVAVREERIRLAQDLHDGVLQALTGIRLQLQALAEARDNGVRDHLLAIERAIAIEQRELRLFIDAVRPSAAPPEESRPLADGLEEMRGRLEREWKTPISIRISSPIASLGAATYRAVRLMLHEAIVNALRHGHPSRVSVDVQRTHNHLKLVVQDDGRGFAFLGRLEHSTLVSSGAGPMSLRDRVCALGGTMAVESSQSGASVEIMLPV